MARSSASSEAAIPRALEQLASLHRAFVKGEDKDPDLVVAEYGRLDVLGHWLEHWGVDAPYGGFLILRSAVEGYLEPLLALPAGATSLGDTVEMAEASARTENARYTRWRWGIGCPPVEEGSAKALTGVVWKTLGNRAKVVLGHPDAVNRVAWLVAGPPRMTIPIKAGEQPGQRVAADPESHWRDQVRRAIGRWRLHHAESADGDPPDLRVDAGQAMALTQLALARTWFAERVELGGSEDSGYHLLVARVLTDAPSLWQEMPVSRRSTPAAAVAAGEEQQLVPPVRGQAGEPQARRRAEHLAALLRAEVGRQAVMLPIQLALRVKLERLGPGDLDPAEAVRLEHESAPRELETQLAVAVFQPDPIGVTAEIAPLAVRRAGVLVAASHWPRATQVTPADMRTRQRYLRESIGPGADRPQIRRLFLEYLEARRAAIERTGYLDAVALAEIALADHGIAYDAVVFEDDLVLSRVAEQLRVPLYGRPDLYAYAGRNEALTLSKSGRFGEALGALGLAVRQITQLGAGHHPVVMGELREQLRLAHAGLFVRVTEHLLVRADAYPPSRAGSHGTRWEELAARIAWTGSQALKHAHAALDDVMGLAGMLGGLPTERHARFEDGGAIPVITNVTKAWQVMPTIQALRAALAVRTAIAAGIIREDRLFGQVGGPGVGGGAGTAPTVDADPWWQLNRDRVRQAIQPAAIEERLVALIAQQRPVTAGHAQLIVPLVLQHSFLTGGRVLPAAAAGGPVTSAAPFLAASSGDHDRPVMDWDAVAQWLSEGHLDGGWPLSDLDGARRPARRHDAQHLSWLEPSLGRRAGLVFQTLTEVSNGEYARFRTAHDPFRPERPSHD